MSGGRELTGGEHKAVALVKLFEDATTERRHTIALVGGQDAAEELFRMETKLRVCKTISVDFIPKTEQYKIVFSLPEFQKYMFYMLKAVGLTLLLDGSLQTYDRLVVSNDYLNGEQK